MQPRLVRREPCDTYPIATHHRPRWNNIRSGELGVEFVNAAHAAFELRGPLDLCVLKKSVEHLVQRHSVLASRVVESPAGPRFVLERQRAVDVRTFDLSGVPARDRRDHTERTAGELIWMPFTSSTEGWFRLFVISLGAAEHIVGLVVHHFICDGWSTAIIKGELLALYAALLGGQRPALPELPIQYFDYVMSVNEWIASGASQACERYWREHLRDAPPTRVPPDFRAPPEKTGTLTSSSSRLTVEAVSRLRELSRSLGVQMNTIVLAALAAVMAHFSGSSDIVVVNRVSGRNQPALLGLVGAFLDSIAVRTRVSAGMTFAALAGQIQETLKQSYRYQDYPYQLVKSALPSVGASDLAPLLNFIDARVDSSSARIAPFAIPPAPPTTPSAGRFNGFHVIVRMSEDGLQATIEYLRLLYKEKTVARFVTTLCDLLDRGSSRPHLTLETLLKR